MEGHRKCAGNEACLCEKCTFRFECFTQERVFTDRLLQSMFEAFMASGISRDDAIAQVVENIKEELHAPDPITVTPFGGEPMRIPAGPYYSDSGGSTWSDGKSFTVGFSSEEEKTAAYNRLLGKMD